ncbi:MAG: hypothetical protein J5736_05560, partial [Bacilli bacterium]|nr:hypothetical protein [Bacilli bacterium]
KRDVTHKNDSTNAYEDLYISDQPLTGFSVDPGHMDRGDGEGVRDKIYIAAYPTESNKANSRSGNQGNGMNVSTFVPKAQEIDSSVFGFEICAQMMLLMLYQIMVADFDAKEIFGENKKQAKPNNGTTDSIEYHTGAAVDTTVVYDLKNIKTFGSFESGEIIPQGTIVNRTSIYRATVDTVGGNWNNVSADFELLQYNNATEYHVGDITTYSGVPFRCVQDCTNKTPSTTSSYWSKYFEGYNPSRSYKKYDREVKDGVLYECKEATTGEFNKTKWDVVEKTINIKFLGIENAWGGYGNHVMGVWGADYYASLYFAINPRSYPSATSELANLTKTNSNNGYYASFIKDLGHNADYPWFFYPEGKVNQKNGLRAAVGMVIKNYTVFYGAYYTNNNINGPFTIDGTSSFNGGNGLARLEILPDNQEN